jgi:hypothetical protein
VSEAVRDDTQVGAEPPARRRERLRRQLGGRPRVVFLRLSEREHAVLTARANQAGVSVQRLLVEAATLPGRTTAERHALYTTLLATQRAVTGAANNLNQVARGANSTGRLPVGWEATAAAVRSGLAALEAALDELRGTTGS